MRVSPAWLAETGGLFSVVLDAKASGRGVRNALGSHRIVQHHGNHIRPLKNNEVAGARHLYKLGRRPGLQAV